MSLVDTLNLSLGRKASELFEKPLVQVLVGISLMAALLMVPATARAGEESVHETKSGFFIKPSSGLDIKPDNDERKEISILSPKRLPLSDNIDISPLFGEPQQKGIPGKKHTTDHRALLGFTFHF